MKKEDGWIPYRSLKGPAPLSRALQESIVGYSFGTNRGVSKTSPKEPVRKAIETHMVPKHPKPSKTIPMPCKNHPKPPKTTQRDGFGMIWEMGF